MSLTTFSVFYYNFEFDGDSRYFCFDEGGGELIAEIALGEYTPTDAALAVQEAFNNVGALGYTVSFNRTDRSFTISVASGTVDLLVSSGSAAGQAYSKIGFTGADRTGAATYTGSPAGNEYLPQFILQDHISTDNYQKLVSPSVNKSAAGDVEVIRFGTEKFLQCNIKFVTNKVSDGKVIRYNPTGVEDLQSFMQYIMQKKPIEFMPNELSRNTYQKMILESTESDSKGTGYKLKELYDKGLPYFFETGPLTFRLVEG